MSNIRVWALANIAKLTLFLLLIVYLLYLR